MKPEISIVIPNWNGKKYLKTCFDSLRKQIFKKFEIILVDNASEDDSIEFIEKNYPEIKIIALNENTGFAKAVNIGIQEARGNYISLFNNDTEAHPKWLKNLYLASQKHPKYYFFACKILCFDKRDTIDSAGDGIHITGSAFRIGHYQKDSSKFNQKQEVFGPCGAANLYKKELFDKIGYFDNDFFAFYEDVDLNFRAQLAGFKCLYIPSAIIYHIGHGSAGEKSEFVKKLQARNVFYVIIKDIPTTLILKYFKTIILFNFWWGIKDLTKAITKYRYNEDVKIRNWARGTVLKNFWKMYKKRQNIQKSRQVNIKYLESIMTLS